MWELEGGQDAADYHQAEMRRHMRHTGGARGWYARENCVSIRALQEVRALPTNGGPDLETLVTGCSRRGGLAATAVLTLRRDRGVRLRAVQEQTPDDIEAEQRRTVGLDVARGQRCQRADLTGEPLGDLLDLRISGREGSLDVRRGRVQRPRRGCDTPPRAASRRVALHAAGARAWARTELWRGQPTAG